MSVIACRVFPEGGYEMAADEAIGWGFDFALAALYLGHPVQKAVETAIELSVYCEGPIQAITRKAPPKGG